MRYFLSFIAGFIIALFLKNNAIPTFYPNNNTSNDGYGISSMSMDPDRCKELADLINKAQQEYTKSHQDQIPKNLHLYYCY